MNTHANDLEREPSLLELEPSPIEEDFPSESYFPSVPDSDDKPLDHETIKPIQRTSTLGLDAHSPVWYLTRIHKYSSYAFSVFTAFHVANTALIPLATRSVASSEPYLLLTRPYYQSPIAEPFIVVLPLLAHIGSGVALRLIRRKQNLKRYGAENRTDRRMVAWPKLSGTSALGYALVPLVYGHAFVNRIIPLWYEGGSSSINLGYVAHGFAKHPAVSFVGFGTLVTVGVFHSVWGWAKWLNWTPSQVTQGGVEGQLLRKRRWYVVNAVSAVVTALWLAGGMGVVGRGGAVGGWVGREYDELYSHIPLIGNYMASSPSASK
jgi:succinate dehydrogenase/fumarate reductase cytochrome b subunit